MEATEPLVGEVGCSIPQFHTRAFAEV